MTIDAYTGSTVTLDATFTTEPGGSVTDPTSVSLSVLDSDGNVDFGPYTYAGGTITRVTTGFYRKALAIPAGTTIGAYTVAWTAVIDGDTRIGYETLNLSEASAEATTDAGPTGIWYTTREQVKRAPQIAETARNDQLVDDAIEAASRMIDRNLHRRFYPQYATRTFDWPNPNSGTPWRLWLDANELVSVTTLTIAGTVVSSSDYFLRPDDGPPYTHLEIDLASSAAFSAGDTHQRAISILGVWAGCPVSEATAGETAEALDDEETGVEVTDSGAVGVGSILRVDSERMIVTGKAMADTGQNLQTTITALASAVTVAVSDGTTFAVGEVILIGSERMLIVDIAGNNLTVKRAFDGTVLAEHTSSADIYAPRTLTVRRGALGTTAASHSSGATIHRFLPPGDVAALCRAQALYMIRQEEAGYGRFGTAGGGGKVGVDGQALADLWDRAGTTCGRKARHRAV